MLTGLLMPRKKVGTESPDEDVKDAKYTEPVKLTKEFKRRLQRVAKEMKLHMGELIEEKMSQFIDAEWAALWEQDRKRDEAAAKQIAEKMRKTKG